MRLRSVLLSVVLCASLSSAATAGPKEDALVVLDQWAKAFAASDVDAIVKLYASDALFMGTGSKSVVTQTADIRASDEASVGCLRRNADRVGNGLSLRCAPSVPG